VVGHYVLLSAGLLAEWDDPDRQAITVAFQRSVELWMASEERKLGNYTGSQMPT
jgi:hypothetical protein